MSPHSKCDCKYLRSQQIKLKKRKLAVRLDCRSTFEYETARSKISEKSSVSRKMTFDRLLHSNLLLSVFKSLAPCWLLWTQLTRILISLPGCRSVWVGGVEIFLPVIYYLLLTLYTTNWWLQDMTRTRGHRHPPQGLVQSTTTIKENINLTIICPEIDWKLWFP